MTGKPQNINLKCRTAETKDDRHGCSLLGQFQRPPCSFCLAKGKRERSRERASCWMGRNRREAASQEQMGSGRATNWRSRNNL